MLPDTLSLGCLGQLFLRYFVQTLPAYKNLNLIKRKQSMEQLFIPGSIIADYFLSRPFLAGCCVFNCGLR